MHFDYSLTPNMFVLKIFLWENWTHKKSQRMYFGIPLRKTFLGTKSSQKASIFHEKNDGGVKKTFFDVTPPENQVLKYFLDKLDIFAKRSHILIFCFNILKLVGPNGFKTVDKSLVTFFSLEFVQGHCVESNANVVSV